MHIQLNIFVLFDHEEQLLKDLTNVSAYDLMNVHKNNL